MWARFPLTSESPLFLNNEMNEQGGRVILVASSPTKVELFSLIGLKLMHYDAEKEFVKLVVA